MLCNTTWLKQYLYSLSEENKINKIGPSYTDFNCSANTLFHIQVMLNNFWKNSFEYF